VFFCCSFLVDGTGVWTLCLLGQGFTLEPLPSPFCFSYFSNRVLHLFLGQRGLRSSYLCFLIGMTGAMCHHTQLFYWLNRGFPSFNDWPQTSVLPISTSWVAVITEVRQWVQHTSAIFKTRFLFHILKDKFLTRYISTKYLESVTRFITFDIFTYLPERQFSFKDQHHRFVWKQDCL
jgi:hypothetical protein